MSLSSPSKNSIKKGLNVSAKPNLGEIEDADAVGTAGSPGCGDMLRIWLKFRNEKDKGAVIDKASFQSFGCETAIAVATAATEMLAGKTIEEAKALDSHSLLEPLGPLPPMKLHCAGLVEEALQQALNQSPASPNSAALTDVPAQGLQKSIQDSQISSRKIVFQEPNQ